MAESLKKLVESLQAEISNLQDQISSGRPTTLLISLIPNWCGTEKSVSMNEFLELVESSARVGSWNNVDKIQVTILKLTEAAKAFCSSNLELHAIGISWENFKAKFLYRFRDFRSDQCHFMQLPTSRQRKEETPQEFLDRCPMAMKNSLK